MNQKEIGDKIRELRLNNKESQEEVCKKLGVSQVAWSKYEAGEIIPRDEMKIKIAEHYGSSVQSLFYS